MTKEIGIIGAGRFGRFAARELSRAGFDVAAADRRAFRIPGVARVSVARAASRPIVLLAVPARALEGVLRSIAPALAPGALVCDLCAVKEAPARWMRELLPPSVDLLGLHPLFGPDSARSGLNGHRIVLCRVRISSARLRRIARRLKALGLVPVESTPRAHDQAMARTLVVTQFAGRALRGLVPERGTLRTRNALLLSEIIRASSRDSEDVLRDLLRYNTFARSVPREILARFRALAGRLR